MSRFKKEYFSDVAFLEVFYVLRMCKLLNCALLLLIGERLRLKQVEDAQVFAKCPGGRVCNYVNVEAVVLGVPCFPNKRLIFTFHSGDAVGTSIPLTWILHLLHL